MALILRNGPLDFHKRGKISTQLLSDPENPVDDHHIFPQGHLNPRGVPPVLRDSILNRTLIDKVTNIRIGKHPPSHYLSEIRAAWASAQAVDDLLESHLLPSGAESPLLREDFDAFLDWRERRLAQEIESVTGVTVGRAGSYEAGVDAAAGETAPAPELLATLPAPIMNLINLRASAWIRPLAERFALEASGLEGVELRIQQSKGDPWYFQIRHPRFPHVVAYVNPRQTELHIDYRLGPEHDTYGVAQRRGNAYGIAMKVRQSADLPFAMRLLLDTLAREG